MRPFFIRKYIFLCYHIKTHECGKCFIIRKDILLLLVYFMYDKNFVYKTNQKGIYIHRICCVDIIYINLKQKELFNIYCFMA
ncbi:hypothetical protein PFTANZ_02381 [Plasmodium falciparum Tanzania (2000708)]|uniref:Uncharacterized protein n=1 Tax=Plasmodium falciparum Tanzania (2000708) TaxID=1036725 RepID=A0A024W9R7_PLAFA|nr:hypothetical protein PFTANZ_02381 [Plasmodium falciparum Tanzania (2000708)]